MISASIFGTININSNRYYANRFLSQRQGLEQFENTDQIFLELRQGKWAYFHGGTLCVDTFFVIGGLLVAYIGTGTISRTFRGVRAIPAYFLYIINRYMRLTPILALGIFSQVAFWPLFGIGPVGQESIEATDENKINKFSLDILQILIIVSNPCQSCQYMPSRLVEALAVYSRTGAVERLRTLLPMLWLVVVSFLRLLVLCNLSDFCSALQIESCSEG